MGSSLSRTGHESTDTSRDASEHSRDTCAIDVTERDAGNMDCCTVTGAQCECVVPPTGWLELAELELCVCAVQSDVDVDVDVRECEQLAG